MTAVIAVAAVGALSLLLRRSSGSAPTGTPGGGPEPIPESVIEDDPWDDDPEAEASAEAAAVTSDGFSFLPVGDRDRVRLIPPPGGATAEPGMTPAGPEQLARGDLWAARVTRGAPDHDPWRLEALGRDEEYRAWRFETEEAARAALALVERRVVRPRRDEDGNPVAAGDADFAAARRREEEIESELANLPEAEDDGSGPAHRPIG